MKPPFTSAGPVRHELQPKVIGRGENARLVCNVKGCGEPIVGAFRSHFSWVGGVHLSDFIAGRFAELQWPDDQNRVPHYPDWGGVS